MPEFVEHEPCGRRVYAVRYGAGHRTSDRQLLGFCTRRVDHRGGCSTLVNDRVTHNIRYQEGDDA